MSATGPEKIVYYKQEDIRVQPQERPTIKSGEVLVEVEAVAICGTDIKTYYSGNPRIVPPQTMGHEFCGTVIETAGDVDRWQIGTRITMATTIGCGECFYCRRGSTNICKDLKPISFYYPGAMAKWIAIPKAAVAGGYLVEIGDLDAELAAMSEPLSCVINNLSKIPLDDVRSAAVIGVGPLGALHAITLRQYGIKTLVGVQRPGKRMDLAPTFGFDTVVAPENLPDEANRQNEGEGFDLVIVTAPDNSVQSTAVQYARKGGYVSLFASLPVGTEMLDLNSRTVHYGEISLYGCSDSTAVHVTKAVSNLRKNPEMYRKAITGRYALSEITTAIDAIKARDEMKVVLTP
jgi:L-iditol 2-dehydrogenase